MDVHAVIRGVNLTDVLY